MTKINKSGSSNSRETVNPLKSGGFMPKKPSNSRSEGNNSANSSLTRKTKPSIEQAQSRLDDNLYYKRNVKPKLNTDKLSFK